MSLGATDKQRSLFLKGFKLSKQGNYEDPTYLGFKVIFDFGTLPINAEDGLPPSPLFKDDSYYYGAQNNFFGSNPFGQPQYDYLTPGLNGKVAYYSAASYLEQREANYPYGGKRADMLRQFKIILSDVLSNSPWFIQSIDGLDKLAAVARPGYQPTARGDSTFSAQRTADKVLEFKTLESMNLRMSALADLYNQATFDYDNMRELIPRNLRKFTMYIFVSEIRNFFKTSRLIGASSALTAIDNLSTLLGSGNNPGSNLGAVDTISGEQNQNVNAGGSNINPASGFNSFVGNVLNQSGVDNDMSLFKNQQDQSGIKPMMVFECRNCEFDFTDSSPIGTTITAGTVAEQVTQKFKIHVGKVRVRNQYPNIRQDGKPLILGDGWDSARSAVQKSPRDMNDVLSLGGELLTNFVSNSLNDLINEGVASFIKPNLAGLDKLALGNAYSFDPGQITSHLSFNNAQNFLNSIPGVNAGFKQTSFPTPQSTGLGGPPQRVYPEPGGDVYAKVPGKDLGVPDRVYPAPGGDVYANVPGPDLGVPDRVYPVPSGDVYANVPGSDLGVPDRIYPAPVGDVYANVPGSDLGVPDRVYPAPGGDVYANVPGSDLGVPDRVYPAPSDDVYANVPGSDLGVPNRTYPAPGGDAYANVPGSDLGVPNRTYPTFNEQVYGTPPTPGQLSNSEVVYTNPPTPGNLQETQVYPDAPFSQSPNNLGGQVYPESKVVSSGGELRDPSNTFEQKPSPVYAKSKSDTKRGDIGKVYPPTSGDFMVDKPKNLGNLKPPTKYNISKGGFNTPKTEFE
jgi:hypothetical protein